MKKENMKKIILLAFISLMIVGCRNSTSTNTKTNNKVNKTPTKFEVLLSTKDTIYIEAESYYMYHGYFGTNTEPEYIFEDEYGHRIQIIHNPVYVKEIKTK